MENVFNEFILQYGVQILYSVVVAVMGYLGVVAKNLFEKYVNTKIKKDVALTCVQAVEQLNKDLHGEEKFNKCMEYCSEMLTDKGISVTSLELKMLIEAGVNEFQKQFNNSPAKGEE